MRTPAKHPHHLRHQLHYYNLASQKHKLLALFLSAAVLTLVVIFFRSSFGFHIPSSQTVTQLSVGDLLVAAGYTLLRLTAAYFVSLFLAIALALIVTSHHVLEELLLPVLDVLQSVPVLAFFPIAIVAFARAGVPEAGAIFVLVMDMMWSIVFNMVGAIHAIPQDVRYAADSFGARGWKFIPNVLLPATFPAIVTGSILAWGQAWNIIIVAEFISFGTIRQVLPGLGSTLDQAAASAGEGDTTLFIAALLVLVALVIILNKFIWHPLINLSERFKFD